MAASISRRVYRLFFINSSISVIVVIFAVWFVYEDLENTLLSLDLQEEIQFLLDNNERNRQQRWQTANLTAFYLPDSAQATDIPPIFQQMKVPFFEEVEWEGKTYQMIGQHDDGGIYYLAKDISLFEKRERLFYLVLAALAVAVLGLNLVMSLLGSRRLVRPLRQLTGQIHEAAPGQKMTRIAGDFPDAELMEIAGAINRFIDEIESFVKRERTLLSLASHELRTPTAVISGAVQVLEQRNQLGAEDRKTLQRIRRAAREMEENITSLLTLARRTKEPVVSQTFALEPLLRELVEDIESSSPEISGRIHTEWQMSQASLHSDPILAKMLLRNLVYNALQHTTGKVQIIQCKTHIDILDEGQGLPAAERDFLRKPSADSLELSGLGLFIVKQICEHLGWRLEYVDSQAAGTALRLWFW